MRNGVGNTGSAPPVISTMRARSSGQPATGKIVRNASCAMIEISPRDNRPLPRHRHIADHAAE
jgi:hypothetical protein